MAKSTIVNKGRTCQEDGCDEKHWGHGYCLFHYNFARNNGLLSLGECKELGCKEPVISKKLCSKHYKQVNNNGHTYRNRNEPNIFEKKGNFYLIHVFDNSGGLKGKVKIDADDYDTVKGLKWCIGNHGYAENVKTKMLLHRLVMRISKDGHEVDHINRNKLDNRKSNLRLVDRTRNLVNSGLRRNNTTGFKGVCWSKNAKKYFVQLSKHNKKVYTGYFIDKVEAAKKYDQKAKEFYGDYAVTNAELGLV